MRVLFAPDWRAGVPYQTLLAEALGGLGVDVDFLSDYKRVLALSRLVKTRAFDVLHLHWPEAYYPRKKDGLDWWRQARFGSDLALATRRHPLVVTAHNLEPHNRAGEFCGARNARVPFTRAQAVIAHSAPARDVLIGHHRLASEKIHVIPHGDLSPPLGEPLPRAEAARQLGLPDGPVCLMFGTVEPYKGIEEVLAHWQAAQPAATLIVVGNPCDPDYAARLSALAGGLAGVRLHLGWLSDEQLRVWLSAADTVLFNYRQIFTSGAASLARSWGVPILIPRRLNTVDLAEPSPWVQRFETFATDFPSALAAALGTAPSFTAAAEWRAATAWSRVARATAEVYARVLGGPHSNPTPQPCAASPVS
ncbi:MAG: glycosyltransferase family 4 protein [Chthoniobacter sp.]|nr:glycosyltransferase family 4 protein [Chthoniobacter sp.]